MTRTTTRLAGGVVAGSPNVQPEAVTAISATIDALALTKTNSSPPGESRAAAGRSR
ncbi:hypothetical protein ACFQY7_37210 [Actinomadura luteofluorescens]|uniref:hypothetical protein n=1 Tax=Actinomadura luteofluorescens TaxID=46163 RepID=UPI003630E60E